MKRRIVSLAALILSSAVTLTAAEPPAKVQIMHQDMLYPVVRVSTGPAAGSGTVVYSEDRGDGCQTYVLTNHHVVEAAIHIKEQWSSLLQRDVKREANEPVTVEIFRYADGSTQDVADSYQADIVAQDKGHDLALVKLRTGRKIAHVARLLPSGTKVAIFEPIWAVGCSLRHPPVVTQGIIDYLDDVIEQKLYWLGSANIIYGNSGGAVFVERDGRYFWIGVPSRVAVTWSQAITHMGYFCPVPRVRQWITDEYLLFLTDPVAKPTNCFAKREELRKQAELRMLGDKPQKPAEPTPAQPKP